MPGNDETHFDRPTDIAWLPDGTFFVTDGYTNTRVVEVRQERQVPDDLGHAKGNGPGPSSILPSRDRHRSEPPRCSSTIANNARIQVFDENGKFLDAVAEHPSAVSPPVITTDQYLVGRRRRARTLLKYDLNGKLLYAWGTRGTFPGPSGACTSSPSITTAICTSPRCYGGRAQKFRPKPGADQSRVDRQPDRAHRPNPRGNARGVAPVQTEAENE